MQTWLFRPMTCSLAALLLLSLAIACSGGDESGIEGQVRFGPLSPAEAANTGADYRPYEATLVIIDAETQREVARVVSAEDGTFRAPLPAGTYRVEPVNQNTFVPPYAEVQTVVVKSGEFASITVVYDSGIR